MIVELFRRKAVSHKFHMHWKKITSNGLKHDHYQADALIICCVDFRGKTALDEFVSKMKFRNYDLIMIPGGAKALVSGSESEGITILNYIKKLIELHEAKRIIAVTHADCGACGGSAAFGHDGKAERTTHEQWLNSVQLILSRHFGIPIEKYFVDFESFWQIT